MLVVKPFCGYEQACVSEVAVLATHIAQIRADLTIRNFAGRATILMDESRRIIALFDDARLVNQCHVVEFAQRVSALMLVGCPRAMPCAIDFVQ